MTREIASAYPVLLRTILRVNDALGERKYERLFRRERSGYGQYESLRFERARMGLMLSWLKDRHTGAALEVGCGHGSFTKGLCRIAGRVTALDVSPAALRLTGERLKGDRGIDLQRGNLRTWLPPDGATYDLIVLSEMLYHLGERNDLVRFLGYGVEHCLGPIAWKVNGLLASGGRLLLAHSYAAGRRAEREAYRRLFEGTAMRLIREQDVEPTGEPGTDRCLVSLLEKGA